MNFRTIIELEEKKNKIDYSNRIMFLGSCFAENIGEIFNINKFKVSVNPYGIVYNPISVANVLKSIISKESFRDDDFIFTNDKWASFLHHGKFSNFNISILKEDLEDNRKKAYDFLVSTDVLIITLGTSWVYENIQTSRIVSNCHKLPSSTFNRYRLSVNDIVSEYNSLINRLRDINPKLKIIFTLSPIRHLKDTAHGNQLSKSVLLLAIDEIVSKFSNIEYFPSYEIVMDDLRDYRFYKDDMIHISDFAVQYIWESFKKIYFSIETENTMKEVNKIIKAVNHRPTDPFSSQYSKFLINTIKKVDDLNLKYPEIDFSKEKESLMLKL